MNRAQLASISLVLLATLTACGSGTRPHSSETLATDPSNASDSANASNASGSQRAASTPPGELPLDQMSIAHVASKVTVPVEVRYQLAGTPVQDQPITLQLAFIPRVAGQNLRVQFPPSDTVTIESGGIGIIQQKADAASVYRRSLLVTPRKGDAGTLRVLVSMDVERGRYFGVFYIPVGTDLRPSSVP